MNKTIGLCAVFRSIGPAVSVVAICWLLFAAINSALPYIGPGADVIYAVKARSIGSLPLFRQEAPVRVVIFGNSKVLTGFVPEVFDSLSGRMVSSFNLGLPDYTLFVDNLERLCLQGQHPTHVLLMFPWPADADGGFDPFHPGIEDKRMMNMMFPFRRLPRDMILFSIRAHGYGGLRSYYADCRNQAERMLAQRGYYFIEGQSHYPGHRLPENFHLQKDTPQAVYTRTVATTGPSFRRLVALMGQYHFEVVFVPFYYRRGEYAPPPDTSSLAAALAQYHGFSVVGPDYLLLPNSAFSDPVHLNEDGAAAYTRCLWELLGPALLARAKGTMELGARSGASPL